MFVLLLRILLLMHHLHHPLNQHTIPNQPIMNPCMNQSHTIMPTVFKMNMPEPTLRLQKILMEKQFQDTTQFNFRMEDDKMLNIQLIIMLDMSLMYRMKGMR